MLSISFYFKTMKDYQTSINTIICICFSKVHMNMNYDLFKILQCMCQFVDTVEIALDPFLNNVEK